MGVTPPELTMDLSGLLQVVTDATRQHAEDREKVKEAANESAKQIYLALRLIGEEARYLRDAVDLSPWEFGSSTWAENVVADINNLLGNLPYTLLEEIEGPRD